MVDMAEYRQTNSAERKVRQEISKAGIPEPVPSSQSRQVNNNLETRIGIFICSCGGSISEVIDVPDVVEYCRGLYGVTHSTEIGYACTDEAAEKIKGIAGQHNLTHVVLAACSCCNLDQICFSCSDRRIHCKSNLLNGSQPDGIYYEFVNIREHCAWVHYSNPGEATAKAKSLIRTGVAHAKDSQLPVKRTVNIEQSILVIGGGLSGMQAAADLAAQGFPTILISRNGQNEKIPLPYDGTSEQSHSIRERLESELLRGGATILYGAKLTDVNGTAGSYQATIIQNGKSLSVSAGAVILDLSAGLEGEKNSSGEFSQWVPVVTAELPPLLQKAFRNGNNRQMAESPVLEPALGRLPGVFLCGTRQAVTDATEALVQGSAAASKASILLNKGTLDTKQMVATVDQQRCRGCGTCASICQFGAIILTENDTGTFAAQVDEALCRGCGICVAHCPSGALSQNGYSDNRIAASLEAILS